METFVKTPTVAGVPYTFEKEAGRSIFDRSKRSFTFLSQHPTVSVIIPTLNEEENLPFVLPQIPEDIDEVILVDGCSTDRTIEVARALRPEIRVVLQHKQGKGKAMRCGFEAATGDIIVVIAADGSNDPAEIAGFVGVLMAGADFAKGTRFMQGAGASDNALLRRVSNFFFLTLTKALFGGLYTDLCYGYNAFWRDVLPDLDLDGDGFEIEAILNIRALRRGLRIAEVPSFEYPRLRGQSRLRSLPDGWRVFKAILREYGLSWKEKFRRQSPPEPSLIPQTGQLRTSHRDCHGD